MNTWFEKPQVHLATWKHPATKQSHMIDFVLMRKEQRRLCQNVRVCRSACCWSDHHMVRGKVQLQLPRKKKDDVRDASDFTFKSALKQYYIDHDNGL